MLFQTKKILKLATSKPSLIFIGILLLYFFKVYQFIDNNPLFYQYWDWPGHIDKALHLSLPMSYGWDIRYWGGFTTASYPLLSHLFFRLIYEVVGSVKVTAAITGFLFSSLLLHSLYIYNFRFIKNKPVNSLLSFSLSVLIIFISDRALLGSFEGFWFAGGISATLATAFLFYFLAFKKWPARSIFLGLMFLTHTLTAFVAGLLLLFEFGLLLYSTKSFKALLSHEDSQDRIRTIIYGAFIGSPWLLTYLDPNLPQTSITLIGTQSQLTLIALVLLTATFLQQNSRYTLGKKAQFFTLIVTGLLAFLPLSTAQFLESLHLLQGIHLYRLQLIIMIASPTLIFASLNLGKLNQKTVGFLLFSIVFSTIFVHTYQPSGSLTLSPIASNLTGKFLDVTSWTYSEPYIHTFNHWLTNNTQLLSSIGLFFESSEYGLEYYSFANSINRNTFKNGTYAEFFNDKSNNPHVLFDLKHTAQILGINYLLRNTTKTFEATSSATVVGTISYPKQQVVTTYFLEQIDDLSLIEPLSQLPEYNPKINLGAWWNKTNHQTFYTQDRVRFPEQLDLSKPPITNLSLTPTKISFTVNSDTLTPLWVKFSYNQYWKLNSSQQNQIYWMTPGHMLIFAKGDTTLVWNPPTYLTISWIISGITLILIALKTKRGK